MLAKGDPEAEEAEADEDIKIKQKVYRARTGCCTRNCLKRERVGCVSTSIQAKCSRKITDQVGNRY